MLWEFKSEKFKIGRLLTPQEVAKILQVSQVWLYRNATGGGVLATFARKLSRKVLRFDPVGIAALVRGEIPILKEEKCLAEKARALRLSRSALKPLLRKERR